MEKKSELTCADLALCMGCACKTPAGFGVIDAVSRERIRVEVEFQGYVLPPDDVTPILRPLQDMTEEESNEVQFRVDKIKVGFFPKQHAEIVRYLIRLQFDVFGWIDAGLAIDKTKI